MSRSVLMSVALRPMRSPQCPKIAAPTGRAAKPTAYVPNEASVPAYALAPGKNRLGKTSAAAVP
jgi:hypothetical protein